MAAANVLVAGGLLLLLEGAVRVLRPDVGPATSDPTLFADSVYVDETGASPGLAAGASGLANGARLVVQPDGAIQYAGNAETPDTAGVWLLLGDSVTMGIGVPPDSTFAGRLAAREAARIVNPSVLGYDTGDYLRAGRAWLASDRVERVTLIWCLNDAYPAATGFDAAVDLRPGVGTMTGWLNARSRLYRWLKSAALDRPLVYLRHDSSFYQDAASLDASLDRVATLAKLATGQGAAFEVVVLPYEPQLRTPPPSDLDVTGPQRLVAAGLSARGVPVRDLTPALARAAGDTPSQLYLWSDGIHLSARGHAVVASSLR